MTFEELKTEAEKQGYKLVKRKQNEAFLPCICGANRMLKDKAESEDKE